MALALLAAALAPLGSAHANVNPQRELPHEQATRFDALFGSREIRSSMPLGRPAGPPPGFFDFCQRLPEECRRVPGAPAVVELTPERRGELERVQSAVNRRITSVEDIDQYGWREHWTYPDSGSGDCEDYALEKRRELIAGGWPAQALFLAVARIPRGKAHTVLVAATSEGDFVLDNRKSAVLPWRRLPYAWKIRQSAAAPARWYIIPRG